jgi:hypothetical protein
MKTLRRFACYCCVAQGTIAFALGWIFVIAMFFQSIWMVTLSVVIIWCGYKMIVLGMDSLEEMRAKE